MDATSRMPALKTPELSIFNMVISAIYRRRFVSLILLSISVVIFK